MNMVTGCVFATLIAIGLSIHTIAHAQSHSSGVMKLRIISPNPVSYKITEYSGTTYQTQQATVQPFSETEISIANGDSFTADITQENDKNVGCTANFQHQGETYSITSRSDKLHNTQCQISQRSSDTIEITVKDKHA